MISDYQLSPRSFKSMSCPKTTPEGSPHEVHAGTRIAPGVFLNERQLCVHAASDGSSPVVVTVTLDEQFAQALNHVVDPPQVAGSAEADAPTRRRKRDG